MVIVPVVIVMVVMAMLRNGSSECHSTNESIHDARIFPIEGTRIRNRSLSLSLFLSFYSTFTKISSSFLFLFPPSKFYSSNVFFLRKERKEKGRIARISSRTRQRNLSFDFGVNIERDRESDDKRLKERKKKKKGMEEKGE